MILSKKAQQITPSLTLSITAKAKKMKEEGIDIIGFGAGEPDFVTPANIQKAAIEAMNKGYTKYTAASGINELKEAIAYKLKTDNNLVYKTSEIIISNGAKQCLANVFEAILNPGDEVIIPMPYWVSYPELVKISGGIPVFPETDEKNSYKYTLPVLKKVVTNKTKAIVLNSPNNPTGTVYTEDELRMIASFAKEYDLILISDEIYEKLIYDQTPHISIASLSEDAFQRTVVINGMSKAYAMTGWRIGYAAGPEAIIKLMSSLQSHTTSNANSITQYAAVEALMGSQETIVEMVCEFKKRRDYMVERINDIKNISCLYPQGAFYVMVNISFFLDKTINGKHIKGSIDFSDLLLEHAKIAVIPGIAFGLDNYIRLSYATSMENIRMGLDRLQSLIEEQSL